MDRQLRQSVAHLFNGETVVPRCIWASLVKALNYPQPCFREIFEGPKGPVLFLRIAKSLNRGPVSPCSRSHHFLYIVLLAGSDVADSPENFCWVGPCLRSSFVGLNFRRVGGGCFFRRWGNVRRIAAREASFLPGRGRGIYGPTFEKVASS